MKLPFKNSFLKARYAKPKYIILHHTWEEYNIFPDSKVDNASIQIPSIWNQVLSKKENEVNYHYIIEKIKDDFIPTLARPLPYICDYKDIEKDFNRYSIHVAVLGNYDIKIPDYRLYSILAYKVINPILRIYGLSPSRIKLHNEVSNKKISCPGEFFDKDRLINQIRRFVINK